MNTRRVSVSATENDSGRPLPSVIFVAFCVPVQHSTFEIQHSKLSMNNDIAIKNPAPKQPRKMLNFEF